MDEQWVQSVLQHPEIFSWHNFKNNIYISLHRAILYLRFIDDIFMIWTENMQELLIFLENLNSKHKTIKFEHNISRSRISFLDAEYSIVY